MAAKFQQWALVGLLGLSGSLVADIYVGDSTATAAEITAQNTRDSAQDATDQRILLAIERLTVIVEYQQKEIDANKRAIRSSQSPD